MVKMGPSDVAVALKGAGFSDGTLASRNIEDLRLYPEFSEKLPLIIELAIDSLTLTLP